MQWVWPHGSHPIARSKTRVTQGDKEAGQWVARGNLRQLTLRLLIASAQPTYAASLERKIEVCVLICSKRLCASLLLDPDPLCFQTEPYGLFELLPCHTAVSSYWSVWLFFRMYTFPWSNKEQVTRVRVCNSKIWDQAELLLFMYYLLTVLKIVTRTAHAA